MLVQCRVCGGKARPRLQSVDFNRKLSDHKFTYYQCAECASLALAVPPPDLDRYYPTDYYILPASRHDLGIAAERERYKLDIVQRFVRTGRLLEIGPGPSAFAFLAKEAGFEVEAVEMDERCCQFLRDVVGVRATRSSDARAVLERSLPLQVVALWHVLEHLPNPMETLAAAAASLSPGGILIIAAPNPAATQLSLFGSRWTHLDAPRHLQLIPASFLNQRAAAWDLQTVLETTTDEGGLGWNAFGWNVSLNHAASVVGLRVPALAAKVICRLARPIERTGSRGTAYTLVLQKE